MGILVMAFSGAGAIVCLMFVLWVNERKAYWHTREVDLRLRKEIRELREEIKKLQPSWEEEPLGETSR